MKSLRPFVLMLLTLWVPALARSQPARGDSNSKTRPSFEVASINPNPSLDDGLTVRLANPSSRFGPEKAHFGSHRNFRQLRHEPAVDAIDAQRVKRGECRSKSE